MEKESDRTSSASSVIGLESAIDDLLALQGRPVIYRPNPELLELDPEPPLCSFCGKGANQVERILQGEHASICSQCVLLCYEILLPDLGSKNEDKPEQTTNNP